MMKARKKRKIKGRGIKTFESNKKRPVLNTERRRYEELVSIMQKKSSEQRNSGLRTSSGWLENIELSSQSL